MDIEILSEMQRQKIKKILKAMDIGLDDFRYGCICNHVKVENNIVTNKITGFEGRGVTDSLAVLSLVKDVWQHLSPEEKLEISEVLEDNNV